MAPPKGTTNNPNGRPLKSRALTTLLETALTKQVNVERANGAVKMAGNKLLAALVIELVTTGSATLPGGKVLEAAPKDWIETVKWLYAHIDGPPKQQIEHSGPDGAPLFPDFEAALKKTYASDETTTDPA